MTSLEEIQKGLAYLDKYCKEVGVIILNQKDFDELGGTFNKQLVWKCNTLFGVKLVIIPAHLYNSEFLKEGTVLILEKKHWDFLKEALNGQGT